MTEEATAEATVPDGWGLLGFDDCVVDPPRRRPSVQQNQYLATGTVPVVDQGSELVAGFTNDESIAYDSDDLPIIVFGDHTRNLKFIDFPFATGADGTKLIAADRSKLDPKFLYFALLDVKVPSRGYNRHFALLREASIAVPSSKDEQRTIASVLTKIQDAVNLEDRRIKTLKELKAATMAKVFREGLRGEPLMQTEIGEMPESWKPRALGTMCRISSGGTPSRERAEFWGGPIPWVKTGEIDYREITTTSETITEEAAANSAAKIFPAGTLLMAMYGQGVTRGKVAFLGLEAATNQACAAFFPDEATLLRGFLYTYCMHAYDKIRALGHGANQLNLSAEILRSLVIPVPSDLGEQQEIYSLTSLFQRRIDAAEERRAALKNIFMSTLGRLMTGQLRVTPLLEQEPAHAS